MGQKSNDIADMPGKKRTRAEQKIFGIIAEKEGISQHSEQQTDDNQDGSSSPGTEKIKKSKQGHTERLKNPLFF